MEELSEDIEIQLLPDTEIRYFLKSTLVIDERISSIMETLNENLSVFYSSPFARMRCEQAAIWVVGYKKAISKRVYKVQQRQKELLSFIERLSEDDQVRFWYFFNNAEITNSYIDDILQKMQDGIQWVELFEAPPLMETEELNLIFKSMLKELGLE